MKPLFIIIGLTIVIIVGGCLTLYTLNAESQKLAGNLSDLEKDIYGQNWDAASEKLENFHNKWDKTSAVWSMLIDHYEIDNIELVLSQLVSFVKNQDKNQALSLISSLKTLIRHIPDKETLKLQNIL